MNPPSRSVGQVSRTEFFLRKDGSLSAPWRVVIFIAIFLLVWPPIAGSVVWWVKFDGADWLLATVIYAYLFGAPSALLAGVVHAVAAVGFRHYSILVPIVAAGFAAILIEKVVVSPDFLRGLADETMSSLELMLFASLIASLICWRLTRRFARTA